MWLWGMNAWTGEAIKGGIGQVFIFTLKLKKKKNENFDFFRFENK